MPIAEIVVWSAMLGGLLTLCAIALGDVFGGRTIGAVRNLLFVSITGTCCVVMTGLPEAFFPQLPERLMMVLKTSLGPMAGAMGFYYVGTWLGGAREDHLVHRMTALAGIVLICAAFALAVLASQIDVAHFRPLLMLAAVVNMVPVLLSLVASVRAARRGDPLARWMTLAIVCLVATTGLHYLHALDVPGLGLGTWVFTAAVTVLFFLLSSMLALLRNRQNRTLARLSRLQQGADPATGLSTGSALIADVEHALWRAARLQFETSVVCLYVSNLYELTEDVGSSAEGQILVALAARIRRAAGFRCVVGLYHPRCFVVVLTMDPQQPPVRATAARLALTVSHPMVVLDETGERHPFRPCVSMGVVAVNPAGATPSDVINEAERQALAMAGRFTPESEHGIETQPARLG